MRRSPGIRACLTYSLLIILIWTVGFTAWTTWILRWPLDEPIALAPAGRIERNIEISLDASYNLVLDFSFGARRAEIMALVGERSATGSAAAPRGRTGMVVPLRWSLTDANGKIVADGEADTHGRTSYGSAFVSRNVATLAIPPGRYRLAVQALCDIPEFRDVPVRLSLRLPAGKVSWGWQSEFAFFAGLANVLLIWPLAALLLLALAALTIRDPTAPGSTRSARQSTVPAAPAPRSAPPPRPPGTGLWPC